MMKTTRRLIVLNNPIFLSLLHDQYDEILYAPIFRSKIQKDQFLLNYKELSEVYTNLIWTEHIELLPEDHVLAWDAYLERSIFNKHLIPFKNRLFKSLDFKIQNSFTSFRKMIESKLPEYYVDAIVPASSRVKADIDYYFYQTKLPLTYFDDRNGMVGREYSTKFSKYLSQGTLDVRYLYNCVKDFEKRNQSNKSTYWIIFELLWREFFYWHYQQYDRLYFSENGIQGTPKFCKFEKYDFETLRSLSSDKFFQAALNELESTGFMSNRARQMFASFWLNDLHLNWRSGASFFEENLIDYDVFSNYGNWMYLAGVGVDPRGKRYFNIKKQLETYDSKGLYLKTWG